MVPVVKLDVVNHYFIVQIAGVISKFFLQQFCPCLVVAEKASSKGTLEISKKYLTKDFGKADKKDGSDEEHEDEDDVDDDEEEGHGTMNGLVTVHLAPVGGRDACLYPHEVVHQLQDSNNDEKVREGFPDVLVFHVLVLLEHYLFHDVCRL